MDDGAGLRAERLEIPPLLRALAEILRERAPGHVAPPPRHSRRAAGVLALFYLRGGDLHLLFFKRTDSAPTHKGQVAFPGGSGEPGDVNLEATALREAREELGVEPHDVVVLGAMHPFDTFVSNFEVSPFCGWMTRPDPEFVAQPSEVETILEIPLAELRRKRNRRIGKVPGFNVPIPLPYYRVGDAVIWGATGGIVGELLGYLDEAEARLARQG